MRAIVSTPDTLGGRWRLDGTRIHVSLIRHWITRTRYGLAEFNDQFPHVNLTQEEADACLAWPFPPISGEPSTSDPPDDLICVCGEDAVPTDYGVWHCKYCGQDWTMTVQIESAVDQRREER